MSGSCQSAGTCQCPAIGDIVHVPAFRAGPVPCGQGRRFIQKEQLCIAVRRHDGALPSPELCQADNPVLMPPSAVPDRTRGIVKYSPIAHKRAIGWVGDELAFWGYPVLFRFLHKFSEIDFFFSRTGAPHRHPKIVLWNEMQGIRI